MWNDNETNIDLFGHARIAKTISALIREERMSSSDDGGARRLGRRKVQCAPTG